MQVFGLYKPYIQTKGVHATILSIWELLKAGHHGSDTSSSELFVGAVAPTYAIISAGRNNRYGHPHTEVTERFATFGIETKNTAEIGSIFMVSDGRELWFR